MAECCGNCSQTKGCRGWTIKTRQGGDVVKDGDRYNGTCCEDLGSPLVVVAVGGVGWWWVVILWWWCVVVVVWRPRAVGILAPCRSLTRHSPAFLQ